MESGSSFNQSAGKEILTFTMTKSKYLNISNSFECIHYVPSHGSTQWYAVILSTNKIRLFQQMFDYLYIFTLFLKVCLLLRIETAFADDKQRVNRDYRDFKRNGKIISGELDHKNTLK